MLIADILKLRVVLARLITSPGNGLKNHHVQANSCQQQYKREMTGHALPFL